MGSILRSVDKLVLVALGAWVFGLSCAPQTREVSRVGVGDVAGGEQVGEEFYVDEKVYKQEDKRRLSEGNVPLSWVQAHNGYVYYIDISPDGKMLVSGGSDKYIKVWDISNLPEIREKGSIRRLYQAVWGPPVRFSEDGKYIFSGSYDFVEVFDRNLNFIDNLRISDKGIQSIEVGKGYVFASDVNGIVYKLSFDGKKLKLEQKRKIHDEEIWKVKLSYDGRYLITASLDKTSKVLDLGDLRVIETMRAHAGPLEFIDVTRGMIALFSADSHISLWNDNFEMIVRLFDVDKKDIIVGTFDRTGRYVISGGKSFKIKVWDTKSYELKRTIEWHNNDIMSLKVTLDNNFIISGDRDGKIAIWKL